MAIAVFFAVIAIGIAFVFLLPGSGDPDRWGRNIAVGDGMVGDRPMRPWALVGSIVREN